MIATRRTRSEPAARNPWKRWNNHITREFYDNRLAQHRNGDNNAIDAFLPYNCADIPTKDSTRYAYHVSRCEIMERNKARAIPS